MARQRRSSRLKSSNDPKCCESDDEPEPPSPKPKPILPKRRKTQGAASSRAQNVKTAAEDRNRITRGKLRLMAEMPLDILFEMFSHLEPVDLLHLSRANKFLRNMLMNRRVNFLWKQVVPQEIVHLKKDFDRIAKELDRLKNHKSLLHTFMKKEKADNNQRETWLSEIARRQAAELELIRSKRKE
ncbi:hypothetical protein H0H92_008053, partial [Tricholoma furcatifolium]